MNRTRRALQGGAMTIVQLVVQVLLQVAIAPLVLHFAGQDALGAYAAIIQCLAYITAIDIGFYAILIKYLANEFGREGVGSGFMRVMVTARAFVTATNFVYAGLVVLLAAQAGPWLGLAPVDAEQARTGLLIYAAWTLVRIPILMSSFVLSSVQDLAMRNGFAALGSVVRFAVSLTLVALRFGVAGLVFGLLCSEMAEMLACRWRFRRLYPQATSFVAKVDRGLMVEMLKMSGSTLLIMVGARSLFFLDNLIVGVLTSSAAASVYYTTQMTGTFGWSTLSRLVDNAAPGIAEMYPRASLEKLQAVYLRLHRYVLILSCPLALGLILFNPAVITLWVGPNQYGGSTLNIGLAIVTFLVPIGCVDYAFLLAAAEIRTLGFVYISAGVLKFALALFFSRFLGPAGVMIATIPAVLAVDAFGQWATQRRLTLPWLRWLQSSLLPAAIPALITMALLALIVRRWPPQTWPVVIGEAGLFVLVYAVFAWRFLPMGERDLVRAKWAVLSWRRA